MRPLVIESANLRKPGSKLLFLDRAFLVAVKMGFTEVQDLNMAISSGGTTKLF